MNTACIVIVISVINCFVNSNAMLAKLFSLEVDEDGRELCATDTPSEEQFSSDFIQCGVRCINKPECLQYNHNKATSSCQLFNYLPSSFASVGGCRSLKSTIQHVHPKNKITAVGNSVQLMCRRTSPLIRWTFYPTGSSIASTVVEGCSVLAKFTGQYTVEITDLSCNLYIAATKMNQSGTYACQDSLSAESPATAQLIVYQSKPLCTANSSNTITFTKSLLLKCELNISGNGAPFMECLDNNTGTTFGSPVSLNSYAMAYVKHADTLNEVYQVTCSVFVNVTTATAIQDTTPEVNVRLLAYMYTWKLPAIRVVCPPGFNAVTSIKSCYGIIQDQLDYDTARDRCRQWFPGAHAVVITKAAEFTEISSFLRSTITESMCPDYRWGSGIWTSGQRRNLDCDSSFVWKPDSSANIDLQYPAWTSGEPNCQDSSEFCLMMVGPSFLYNDAGCTNNRCVLCEFGPN